MRLEWIGHLMDLKGLPGRTTPDREYLGAICELLIEQTTILERLATRVAAIEERINPLGRGSIHNTDQSEAVPTAGQDAQPEPPASSDISVPIESPEAEIVNDCQSGPLDETPAPEGDPQAEMAAEESDDAGDPEPIEIQLTEPAIPQPPNSGPGSGRDRWVDYATSHGIKVKAAWNKARIVKACRDAGI